MKLQQENRDTLKKITLLFLGWKALIVIAAILAINFLPLFSNNFLGGGFKNYPKNPYILSWGNFDGEHYLAIAYVGYKGLEQAFFPVYPILMRAMATPFGVEIFNLTIAGIIISNLAFFLSLFFLYKLVKIDFNEDISWLTIILLMVFPTSFYFGAVYTESLYLLLIVLSFYFARKKNWPFAALIGAIASATRVFGVLLLPALLIEAWQQKESPKKFFWIFLIPTGLVCYMLYQWVTVGDPFAFYRLQLIVGPQHQSGVILLPQVIYRYINILTTMDFRNTLYPIILIELLVGISFFLLPIYGYFKKIRLSYLFFAFLSFIIPTIQGSFSSLPRYVLVLFPSFIALAIVIEQRTKYFKNSLLILFTILLFFLAMLFVRGYWVA